MNLNKVLTTLTSNGVAGGLAGGVAGGAAGAVVARHQQAVPLRLPVPAAARPERRRRGRRRLAAARRDRTGCSPHGAPPGTSADRSTASPSW